MSLKIYPIILRSVITLMSIAFAIYNGSSQTIDCTIGVDLDPAPTFENRKPNVHTQVLFPIFTPWSSPENIYDRDEQYTTVTLDGYRHSTALELSGFHFDIPPGATISGISLTVTGHTVGQGIIQDKIIKLKSGQDIISTNKANRYIPTDKGWDSSPDTADFRWTYGGKDDTWGLSLTEGMINNEDFGVIIQIRNRMSQPVEVFVDEVSVTVYYTPLYSICNTHSCVPFYIFAYDNPDDWTYYWNIPQGWELISRSEKDTIINIKPSYADFGTYEICIDVLDNEGEIRKTCCRKFNYVDCRLGSIGGVVFEDLNQNGVRDSGEPTTPHGELFSLYNLDDELVTIAFADLQGQYLFEDIAPGEYYIKANISLPYIFTYPDIGNDDFDNDFYGLQGHGNTETITLHPGQDVRHIDLGYTKKLSIGDFVWEDINGNGIQDQGEPGIAGVEITLTNLFSGEVSLSTTDENGVYLIGPLIGGQYQLHFNPPVEYFATTQNTGNSDTDSDIDIDGEVTVNLTSPGIHSDIDAGYYREGSIGDFVWIDDNNNGIQDVDEQGVDGIMIYLYKNDILMDSIISDDQGYYIFDHLRPGEYRVELDLPENYVVSPWHIGNSLTDNDAIMSGHKAVAMTSLSSGQVISSLDIGLVNGMADLGGFTWIDANGDGQYGADENILSGIEIMLYNTSNELIATTVSDDFGYYLFEQVTIGSYYLVFQQVEGFYFTTPYATIDIIDSDVTQNISPGSTDTIVLQPDMDQLAISAGYVPSSSISGKVFFDIDGDDMYDPSEPTLSNIVVHLYSSNNELLQSTATLMGVGDINGTYTFDDLPAGDYYILFDIPSDFLVSNPNIGDETIDSDITHSQDVNSTDLISLTPGTDQTNVDGGVYVVGSIGDFVWIDEDYDGIQDPNELGIPDIKIFLYQNDVLVDSTTSGVDGQYLFENIHPGNYRLAFDLPEGYQVSPWHVGDSGVDNDGILTGSAVEGMISLSSGEINLDFDFGIYQGLADLGGFTWIDANVNGVYDTSEEMLPGVKIMLYDTTGTLLMSTTSDEAGVYLFPDLVKGQYYIIFETLDQFAFTIPDMGDDQLDSDVTHSILPGSTDTISLLPNIDNLTVNAGYTEKNKISGQVWQDENYDGQRQSAESPIEGFTVTITHIDGALTLTTQTGSNGTYTFNSIPSGDYILCGALVEGKAFTLKDTGDDMTDSDVSQDGCTSMITVLGSIDNIDIGIIDGGSISGKVFLDINGNDMYSSSDETLNDIDVHLYDQSGTLVKTSITTWDATQSLASYRFDHLIPGNYFVVFDIGQEYILSTPNVGDDTLDSDVTGTFQTYSTDLINLSLGENLTHIDAGIYLPGTISSRVWLDSDEDGIFSVGESGIENVEVKLFSSFGQPLATTLTDAEGLYSFGGLKQGLYYLQFIAPAGYSYTLKDQGLDDTLDSDCDDQGITPLISLAHGATLSTVSCGLIANGNVVLSVWEDFNTNGLYDIEEAPLQGVRVGLYNENHIKVAEKYSSERVENINFSVKPGKYYMIFYKPEKYAGSLSNGIWTNDFDSDLIYKNHRYYSPIFEVYSYQTVQNIDAGFYVGAELYSTIWVDKNHNGLQDDDMSNKPKDIYATIFDLDGHPYFTKGINDDGVIRITGIPQGNYYIEYYGFGDVLYTINKPEYPDLNSDVTHRFGKGTTDIVELKPYTSCTDVDAGIMEELPFEVIKNLQSDSNHLPELRDEKKDKKTFTLFPNPTINYIRVKNPLGENTSLKVIDRKNQVVMKTTISGEIVLDIQDLYPGLYRVVLDSGREIRSLSFIKIE